MSGPDLSAFNRGSVLAPAGCGKTQLIADTLGRHTGGKPILVLTHTNAGKAALEQRLARSAAPREAYRVFTIDSWAVRLASKFPQRCGVRSTVARLASPSTDYPILRAAVATMLDAGHLDDALRSTYARLLVDEYQDCSLAQHAIVVATANVLPTVVLGDPMQAIFGFAGPTVDWKKDVRAEFPEVLRLQTPWRWDNAGTGDLGRWLLSIRKPLWNGEPIDLRDAPSQLTWVALDGNEADIHRQRMKAAMHRAPKDGNVLVIGKSAKRENRHQIASVCPGAVVVEPVDFPDLISFGSRFKPEADQSTEHLLDFASDIMTGVSRTLLSKRLAILGRGRHTKPPSEVEAALQAFAQGRDFERAAEVLFRLASADGARVYRPEMYRMCRAAMKAAQTGSTSFHEAAMRGREAARHLPRRVASRSVGSTLLLKGLEADAGVVLYPEEMDGKHLYVALTRGAKQVVVCAKDAVLTPMQSKRT